ncbi:MAG: ATP-dependent zinc protease family protein, partial [Gammaproteobacteria bacterium]
MILPIHDRPVAITLVVIDLPACVRYKPRHDLADARFHPEPSERLTACTRLRKSRSHPPRPGREEDGSPIGRSPIGRSPIGEPAPQTPVGWREWLALPALRIPAIKAKMDTGARTSALHTFRLERYDEDGRTQVRFWIHPLQGRGDIVLPCVAEVIDLRTVSDSGGHRERRYVIRTALAYR